MLKNKIQNALDEARILVLVAQVLLGFQYSSIFQKGFDALPVPAQYLKVVGLGLLLVAFGLLTSPASYHQIAARGEDRASFHRYITKVMGIALLPFAVGLGIDAYVAVQKVAGTGPGVVAGVVAMLIALLFWYGLELIQRKRESMDPNLKHEDSPPQEEQSKGGEGKDNKADGMKVEDRVKQVLTEARVVLPGAQALLGFQFATMLVEGF